MVCYHSQIPQSSSFLCGIRWYKPSSHHHFYRWYKPQMGGLWHCFTKKKCPLHQLPGTGRTAWTCPERWSAPQSPSTPEELLRHPWECYGQLIEMYIYMYMHIYIYIYMYMYIYIYIMCVCDICQLGNTYINNHSKLVWRMEFLKPHMISQEVRLSSINEATNSLPNSVSVCVWRNKVGKIGADPHVMWILFLPWTPLNSLELFCVKFMVILFAVDRIARPVPATGRSSCEKASYTPYYQKGND